MISMKGKQEDLEIEHSDHEEKDFQKEEVNTSINKVPRVITIPRLNLDLLLHEEEEKIEQSNHLIVYNKKIIRPTIDSANSTSISYSLNRMMLAWSDLTYPFGLVNNLLNPLVRLLFLGISLGDAYLGYKHKHVHISKRAIDGGMPAAIVFSLSLNIFSQILSVAILKNEEGEVEANDLYTSLIVIGFMAIAAIVWVFHTGIIGYLRQRYFEIDPAPRSTTNYILDKLLKLFEILIYGFKNSAILIMFPNMFLKHIDYFGSINFLHAPENRIERFQKINLPIMLVSMILGLIFAGLERNNIQKNNIERFMLAIAAITFFGLDLSANIKDLESADLASQITAGFSLFVMVVSLFISFVLYKLFSHTLHDYEGILPSDSDFSSSSAFNSPKTPNTPLLTPRVPYGSTTESEDDYQYNPERTAKKQSYAKTLLKWLSSKGNKKPELSFTEEEDFDRENEVYVPKNEDQDKGNGWCLVS